MIFSPNQFYVPFGKCYTPDPLWTPCWKRICEETFIENIGCSVKADQACPTPFQKTFILSRYPLNIISSLSTKWCTPGLENSFDPWVKQSRGKASWFAQFTNRMERYHFHGQFQLFPKSLNLVETAFQIFCKNYSQQKFILTFGRMEIHVQNG